jgi:hypothetical protein
MDRIYLSVICASLVLLTVAIGVASPQVDGIHHPDQLPLLLRTIPR